MKKICLIIYNMAQFGGAERVTVNLANALTSYFQVFVISIVLSKKESCFEFEDKVNYHTLLDSQKRLRYNLIQGIYKLRKYIKDNEIDVAISIGSEKNIFLIGASLNTNTKTIVCEHSNMFNIFYRDYKIKICQQIGTRYADKIITLTQADKIAYIEKYKINKNKIDYIYNFIDDELLKNQANYNQESKIILSVGRFDMVKGYEMLVRVAKMVFDKHPDWQWHIYGDGDQCYVKKINDMITTYGLKNNILLKGECKNIYTIYEKASIFVLTSYFESFSMVLLEAKVKLLPTVSFDCPTGPREIIEHDKSGFLIEAYNEKKMAEKICILIKNIDLRQEFSLHAKDNLYKFNRKTIIERWVELIENL